MTGNRDGDPGPGRPVFSPYEDCHRRRRGISGLVVDHLLHREHDITVFEAAGYAGGTRTRFGWTRPTRPTPSTPASSCSTTGTTPTSNGCSIAWGGGSTSTMTSASATAAATSSTGPVAQRPVRQAGALGHAVVSPDGGRPGPLQPRRPRAGAGRARREGREARWPGLGQLARAAGLHRPFIERSSCPRRRRCGRPTRGRCGPSLLGSWSSSSTITGCFVSRPAALADRQRRLGTLRRGADEPPGRRLASSTPVESVRRGADHVLVQARGRAAAASTRSCSPPTQIRRSPCLPTPTTRARPPGRHPLSGQRGGAPHRHSILPRRRHAWASWNYHLRRHPTGRTTVTYHMNRLQSLRAEREFCVTLNRTDEIDPAATIRTISYSHPVLHRGGDFRSTAHRRDQRATVPTSVARTGAGAFTRTGWAAVCASPSTSEHDCDVSCIYKGTIRHRRSAPEKSSATGWRSPTSTSPSSRGSWTVAWLSSAPGCCAFAGATTWVIPPCHSIRRVRDCVKSAPARALPGPSGCSRNCAPSGTASTR